MKNSVSSQPPAAGEAAHTPTPWRITDPKTISPQQYPQFPYIETERGRLVAEMCSVGPKAKANAAFIVRACNSHAALVEALAQTIELLQRAEKYVPLSSLVGYDDQMMRNRAALAAAKEGQA